jgi:hypothetical protein
MERKDRKGGAGAGGSDDGLNALAGIAFALQNSTYD